MRTLLVAALLLALVLAGCAGNTAPSNSIAPQPLDTGQAPAGGTATTTAATANPQGGLTTRPSQDNAVTIKDFKFTPADLTIKAGDSVTWTNQDGATHTVTSTGSGAFDSGNLATGATYSHTFTQAGTYSYHCNIHTSMTGTITVE